MGLAKVEMRIAGLRDLGDARGDDNGSLFSIFFCMGIVCYRQIPLVTMLTELGQHGFDDLMVDYLHLTISL